MAQSASDPRGTALPKTEYSAEAVLYLIHHVFLPPKLPQRDEQSPTLDNTLANEVLHVLQKFNNLVPQKGSVDAIVSMVKNFRNVHDKSGHISETNLQERLTAISKDESIILPLHVSAQNAGMVFYRNPKDVTSVIIEVFELSPNNNSINSTIGRLQRSFPAFAVSIPLTEFSDPGFQATMSHTISRMSKERIDEMVPKVRKAREMQNEYRDTIIPHLVTEHLVSFLLAFGEPISTSAIVKNTREEVMWMNSRSPWQRSPVWLLLRVSMQLAFLRLSADPSESLYKAFMIFFMSRIQSLAFDRSEIKSDLIYAMNAKMSQRLIKFGDFREQPGFTTVQHTMKIAQASISARWESVMAAASPAIDLSAVQKTSPSKDIFHSIPRLDDFLCKFKNLAKSKKLAKFEARGNFPWFHSDSLPDFSKLKLNSDSKFFDLAALETWVELHLETWLNCQINLEDTCVALNDFINRYHCKAEIIYTGNPEAISLMILTILDLWVACDKTACRLNELLKQFNHQIDPKLLSSLLLPLQSQLSRVSKIESYLRSRAAQISGSLASPFHDFGHRNSYAVQYFDQSPPTRNTLSQGESGISNADRLLQAILAMRPKVRVIIDVGAQILEYTNQQVAETWLGEWTDLQETEAAGEVELLQVSPYASRLGVYLIFLDEAHTRGTDLKLPAKYRAAVTLGPFLTKDRLVQACMRMRKLGKGQSLVFCITDEIRTKINQFHGMVDKSSIEVLDVLARCISETFVDLRRNMPLWATQGRRFIEQEKVWEKANAKNCIILPKETAKKFLEGETKSLEHRYRPHTTLDEQSNGSLPDGDVARILTRCHEFNISTSMSEAVTLEEEQERELSPEIEEKRQVEKPGQVEAMPHSLHNDLISLVATGKLEKNSKAFLPAFESLWDTTAGRNFGVREFSGNLLVTADFAQTVEPTAWDYLADSYLRPVQWILICTDTDEDASVVIIIISPYEANRLLREIRKFKKVTMHCYLPRPSLQFRALDSLDLFTEGNEEYEAIPEQLVIQLNLFACQLYFSNFEQYTATCEFLGLAWKPQGDGVEVSSDGFIVNGNSRFSRSPVHFLYLLMTKMRRNCDSIEKTHMGRILSGTLLERSDFDAGQNGFEDHTE